MKTPPTYGPAFHRLVRSGGWQQSRRYWDRAALNRAIGSAS